MSKYYGNTVVSIVGTGMTTVIGLVEAGSVGGVEPGRGSTGSGDVGESAGTVTTLEVSGIVVGVGVEMTGEVGNTAYAGL